jgi:hypothetical protein
MRIPILYINPFLLVYKVLRQMVELFICQVFSGQQGGEERVAFCTPPWS